MMVFTINSLDSLYSLYISAKQMSIRDKRERDRRDAGRSHKAFQSKLCVRLDKTPHFTKILLFFNNPLIAGQMEIIIYFMSTVQMFSNQNGLYSQA
jgi:hypothetical protein